MPVLPYRDCPADQAKFAQRSDNVEQTDGITPTRL